MKKKIFVVLLIALLSVFCIACGSKSTSKSDTSSKDSDTTSSEQASNDSDSTSTSDEATTDEGDSEDPANADQTEDNSSSSTSAVKAKYVGTWKLKGILYSDGSIVSDGAGSAKYVIKSDGTYTETGKDADGNTISDSGSWSLNSKNKLVAGSATMGINSKGYMLKYTGQRDGKGNKLNYAFKKAK